MAETKSLDQAGTDRSDVAGDDFPGLNPAMTQPPALQPSFHAVDVDAPCIFDNDGFPTQLAWVSDLDGAKAHRRRATELPQLNPAVDPSIGRVATQQEIYICEMIKAVYRIDTAKDNPDYEGRPLFTRGHQNAISAYDVEAACRVLFEAVLIRCKVGYCGPRRENRQFKRGFNKADLRWNCELRIAFVIKALREWKSICKEVINSDAKIEDLANAPASVGQAKLREQINNATKKASTQNDRAVAGLLVQGKTAEAEGNKILVSSSALVPDIKTQTRNRLKPVPKLVFRDEEADPAAPTDGAIHQSASQQPHNGAYAGDFAAAMEDTNFFGKMSRGPLQPTAPAQPFSIGSHTAVGENDTLLAPPPYGQFYPRGSQSGVPSTPLQPQTVVSSVPFDRSQRSYLDNAAPLGPGLYGGNICPGNTYNSSGGTHYNFGEMPWPYKSSPVSFADTFNGDLTAATMDNSNRYMPSFNYSIPAQGLTDHRCFNGGASQSSRPLNSAAKHYRSASMNAQSQPESTRVKRNEAENDTVSNLDRVDE